jgi:hypothetical protein
MPYQDDQNRLAGIVVERAAWRGESGGHLGQRERFLRNAVRSHGDGWFAAMNH